MKWLTLMQWIALLGAFPAPIGVFMWLLFDWSPIPFFMVAIGMEAFALAGLFLGMLIMWIVDEVRARAR